MTEDVAIDETPSLISSDRVEGTAVYNRDGEKLGFVYNFMVDKRSGQVEYAVLSFGSIFGIGGEYYPLPWDMLKYEPEQGGYVVDIDKSLLEDAPRYSCGSEPTYGRDYAEAVYAHYGLTF